jgi:hypothetical protein
VSDRCGDGECAIFRIREFFYLFEKHVRGVGSRRVCFALRVPRFRSCVVRVCVHVRLFILITVIYSYFYEFLFNIQFAVCVLACVRVKLCVCTVAGVLILGSSSRKRVQVNLLYERYTALQTVPKLAKARHIHIDP